MIAKNLALKAGICVLRLNHKFVQGESESAEQQAMEQQQESSSANAESAAMAAGSAVSENKT